MLEKSLAYLRVHPAQQLTLVWLLYTVAFWLLSSLGAGVMLLALFPVMWIAYQHGREHAYIACIISTVLNFLLATAAHTLDFTALLASGLGTVSVALLASYWHEQLEAALRAQQQLQTRVIRMREEQNVVQDARDAIFTVSLEGRITTVNPAFEHATGWESAAIIGRSFARLIHPDDLPLARRLWERFLGGNPVPLFELRIQKQSGEFMIAQFTVTPQRQGDKNVGLIGVARDVTAYKRSETDLRESEERYRVLVEQSPDPILVHGNFTILYANSAAIALVGVENKAGLIGKSIMDFIPDHHKETIRSYLEQVYASNTMSEPRTDPMQKADGTLLEVEIIGAPITFNGQRARQLMIRDITHRKRAQAQELELSLERERIKVLRQFISNASHDLKTPLSSIKLSLYLLKKHRDSVRQQDLMDMVEMRFNHLEKLVDDLFNMSRLDSESALDFKLQPVNLSMLFKQSIEANDHRARDKNVQVERQFDESIGRVWADPDEFYTALNHLVENAINYTPSGGKVSCRIYRSDHQITLEVRDTGIGIPEEALPHIFDRFYRGDDARSAFTGGTGLGLSIAQRIIEFHNGTIQVESRLNEGSIFRICLPVSQLHS